MAQTFVSYCALRQMQWNKNNNVIKTKFTPTALNIKDTYRVLKYKKYELEKTKIGRIWQYDNLQKFKQETNLKRWHANIK